jgi:hypothetical protein
MGPNPRIAGRPYLVLGVAATAVIVGIVAFHYFGPSLGNLNFWEFVALWLREIALLVLAIVVLFGALAAARARRAGKQL